MESIIESIVGALSGIPSVVILFLISMLPILELRGGLIAAAIMGVDLYIAVPVCILGNLFPLPFILLFIEKLLNKMKNTKFVKLVDKLELKAEKNAKKIMKHKRFGLLLFVGIPLPMTGAWTGALVAALFKFKLKESIPSILGGLALAACIMTFITYALPEIVKALA